jgi:hypothetical protein
MMRIKNRWLSFLQFSAIVLTAGACADQASTVSGPLKQAAHALASTAGDSSASLAMGATVATDKEDYQPGDTVTIAGAGFQAGEQVELRLVEDPELHDPRSWIVVADSVGGFVDKSFSPEEHHIGVGFTLTATGLQSGSSAATRFTDATPTALGLFADVARTEIRQAFERGETVYARAVASSPDLTQKYRFNISGVTPFGASYPGYPSTCVTPVGNNLDDSHTLAATDPLSNLTRENYRLSVYNTTVCGGGIATNRDLSFFVYQAWAYTAAVSRNACTDDVTCGSPTPRPSVTPASTVYLKIRGFTANRVGSAVRFLKPDGTIACHVGGIQVTALTSDASGALSIDYPAAGCPAISAADDGAWTVEATGNFTGATGAVPIFGSNYPAGSGYVRNFTATLDAFSVLGPTTTDVSADLASPQELGTSVIFTAHVTKTSGGANVTAGTVEFRDGADCTGTLLQAAGTVDGSGRVTYTTSSLAIGNHEIRGCYSGNNGPAVYTSASNGALNYSIGTVATTTAVTPVPASPQEFGTSVTFTASVTRVTGGAAVDAGSVEFREGGTDCSTGTVVQAAAAVNASGQQTYTTTTLTIGAHTIRACYADGGVYGASNGTAAYTITTIATTTSVSPSPASAQEFGTSVTFTAEVNRTTGGANVVVGNVEFRDGGTDCSTGTVVQAGAAVNGSGEKTYTTTALAIGGHTIRACYADGGGTYAASNGTAAFTITTVATNTVVTASPASPAEWGTSVTFTATVTRVTGGAAVTTGTVQFRDGGTDCSSGTVVQAAAAVNSSGQKTYATSTLAVGNHTIRGCYVNGGTYAASNGSLSYDITKATTALLYSGGMGIIVPNMLTLSATLSSAAACVSGKTITFKITVNPAGGALYSTTAATNATGNASVNVSTSGWAEGTYDIEASFAEDASCKHSKDDAVLLVVLPGNAATGGGFYIPPGGGYGRTNFGFNVRMVSGTGTVSVPAQYKGQFLLNSTNWRCKGTLSAYGISSGVGVATGTCDVQWRATAEDVWTLVQAGVGFQIKFTDAGSGARKTIGKDSFGFSLTNYTGTGTPQSNFTIPVELKGGDISTK